jgi:hypothetical protein
MKNKKDGGFLFLIDIDENYRNQLEIWLKAHNISFQKVELFYDFLLGLNNLINSTFMGHDSYHNEIELKSHFDWCWEKTIENFSKEKIIFKSHGIHYEYFWNFFYEAYYYPISNGNEPRILEYLKKLFDLKLIKSRSEIDLLNEIYKMLNQNLK